MERDQPTNELRLAAEDEAIAWIARLRAADVTDREKADFALWLNSSAIRKDAFDDMLDLWALTGPKLNEEELTVAVPEAEPAQAAAQNRPQPNSQPNRVRRWATFGIAAAVLGAAANFGVLLFNAGQTLETQPGEQRRVMLSDGSNLHLNTDTELTVRLMDDRRIVHLERGEAYFEVAKDPSRPFIVETANARTKVLGTAFAVRSFSDSTLVAVSHGRVAVGRLVDSELDMQALLPNQSATVTPNEVTSGSVDAEELTRWRGGQLVYDGVPLRDVLEDLDRYLPANIVLQDESLGMIPVFAVVQLQDQGAMLDALAETLSLQWNQVDRLIFIRAR